MIHITDHRVYKVTVQLLSDTLNKENEEAVAAFVLEKFYPHADSRSLSGSLAGWPKTNNGLESLNNVLKNVCTDREIMGVGDFMSSAFVWIRQRSLTEPDFQRSANTDRGYWEVVQTFIESEQRSLTSSVGNLYIVPSSELMTNLPLGMQLQLKIREFA